MTQVYTNKTFFTYEADTGTFQSINSIGSADTTQNLTFNIQGDSDFFWQKFAAFCTLTNTTTPGQGNATTRGYGAPGFLGAVADGDILPGITMSLLNATTGRSMSDVPIALPNIDGYLNFIDIPWVWPKKSTIQITLNNELLLGAIPPSSEVGSYFSVQLSFMGTKAFY